VLAASSWLAAVQSQEVGLEVAGILDFVTTWLKFFCVHSTERFENQTEFN